MQVKGIARGAALTALFLIPLVPVFVSDSLFFPFITGKAFLFRILVEILAAAWAVLAFLDKQYRPRFSVLGALVLAFIAWMFFADLFAVNVAKAFWSNFERMEGWVLLIHLYGFFVAGGAVLRAEKGWWTWRGWFCMSLLVSAYVVIYSLLQLADPSSFPIHQGSTRIDASFGNSAYLAIYFLFNTFIAGWLALTESKLWLRITLLILALVEGLLIFATETRGTVLALIGGLLIASFLTAITASKTARRSALTALVCIVVVAGGLYLARDTSFVQNNHILQRVTSISLADGQTRFTIWHMAFEGFKERPIVGWGQEGFNYVFNKYYDPSLYAQEPWFDRAHNAFIDWLMAGGLPAFLLYLSLFVGAIATLWKYSNLSRPERIALTAALIGYAFHNLFVFDNLYSYVYFFAILALIDSQVARPIAFFEQARQIPEEEGMMTLGVSLAALLVILYAVNIPGIRASNELISVISVSSAQPVETNLSLAQDLVAHPSFAAQEIREQLVSLASEVAQQSSIPDDTKKAFVSLALSEMQKQIKEHPGDARELLELVVAYRTAGDGADALATIKQAEALSPEKEQIYVQEGIMEWSVNNAQAAKAAFDKAYALGPSFTDLAAYAAAGDVGVGSLSLAHQTLQNAFGTTTVDNDVLAYAYYQAKDFSDLIALWQLRVHEPDHTMQTWVGLAGAYYAAGDRADAIAAVKAGVAENPDAAQAAQGLITQIESGSVPQ